MTRENLVMPTLSLVHHAYGYFMQNTSQEAPLCQLCECALDRDRGTCPLEVPLKRMALVVQLFTLAARSILLGSVLVRQLEDALTQHKHAFRAVCRIASTCRPV